MGRRSNGVVVFAFETCALDLIEATYEREVYPGEELVVDKEEEEDEKEGGQGMFMSFYVFTLALL